MNEAAVNALIGADVVQPGLLSGRELSKPASQDVVFGKSIKLGILLNNIFERLVIDLRLPCLLGALFRDPAALFQ